MSSQPLQRTCSECGGLLPVQDIGRPRTRCADCAEATRPLPPQGGKQAAIDRLLAGAELGPVDDYLAAFELHLRAKARSKATIERYLIAARHLSAFLGPGHDLANVRRADIERFNVHSLETAAGSTASSRHTSLAQFFKFLVAHLADNEGLTYANPMAGMTAPTFTDPVIVVPTPTLVAAMLATARDGTTYEDIRDYALLCLFVDTGARIAEITGMTLGDILDIGDGEGHDARVIGKSKGRGPVERRIPYSDTTHRAIKRYLRIREVRTLAAGSDALWIGMRGPMTTSGIRQMVWARSEAEGQRIHPHQFRHFFADGWLRSGRSEGNLMRITGWYSRTMPDRYAKELATERAHLSYRAGLSPLENLLATRKRKGKRT